MNEVLKHFYALSSKSFFSNIKARENEYDEFCFVLQEPHEITGTKPNYFTDYPRIKELIKSKNYVEVSYFSREHQFLKDIKEKVIEILDEKKISVYITLTIGEINQVIRKLETLELDNTLSKYKKKIIANLHSLTSLLSEKYSLQNVNNPKIQWTGKTNLLATLIYDLWQGQEKGDSKAKTKTLPLIKAQKKDLEQFLINNFLDQKGKPFTTLTISDYLNTSKPEKRVKPGGRIEIPN